jgi:hypothetical protein
VVKSGECGGRNIGERDVAEPRPIHWGVYDLLRDSGCVLCPAHNSKITAETVLLPDLFSDLVVFLYIQKLAIKCSTEEQIISEIVN